MSSGSGVSLQNNIGGMGLNDLKIKGIILASKWIIKGLNGNEPWNILIRNNISMSLIKKDKTWKNKPF